MKVDKLKEMIRNLIEEIEDEDEMDEATTTGAVDGYKTPHAFSSKDGERKKNKRMADIVGYTQVNENEQSSQYINVNGKKIKVSDSDLKNSSKIVKLIQKADPKVGGGFDEIDINPTRIRLIPYSGHSGFSYNIIKEATNRYHQLRKEEGTPNQKIGKGIREMRKQLQEIEKFIEWYSKIKTENDLDSSQYWKRTQRHLNVMRERLNKISQKIQNLSA
jgi:hypothetical protein